MTQRPFDEKGFRKIVLERLDRTLEVIASVRDPAAQVASLVDWHFDFFRRGISLEEGVVADVLSTDFGDPQAIIQLLERNADTFLNYQSSYVIAGDFSTLTRWEFEECSIAIFVHCARKNAAGAL